MYQLLSNTQFYQKYITFSTDLDVTTASPMNQMDKSYLNILQVHLNPITFSISPPDESLIPLFTGLSTQEFPYKENTIQNHMMLKK